jgi:SPP1 gp7 family putative phage head morphogenesis protein
VNRRTAYAAAAYCFVALRYRADRYSEPALYVAEETEDGEEWLQDHELAAFLDAPSPDYDMGELLRLTSLYRDMTGMCLWLKKRSNDGKIARLVPFSGDDFTIEMANGRIFGRFKVETNVGPKYYGPDDVVLFRETNPSDWLTGLSIVDVMLSVLNLAETTRSTVKNLLRNAVWPSIVVQTHPEWAPRDDDWKKFKDALDEHALPENKGKPLAITGGGTATRVQFSLKELLPDEVMDRIESTVAAISGIPAVVLQYLVGLKNSPWSQMGEAHRQAITDTIQSLWRRDEKVMTRQLLRAPATTGGQTVDEDPTHVIRFDRTQVAALQVDEGKRSETADRNKAFWTVNELRIYTGQEPLEDGDPRGDVIIGMQAPADPNKPSDNPKDNEDPKKAAPRRAKKALAEVDRGTAWLRFDIAAKAQEESWASACNRQIKEDRDAILAAFDEKKSAKGIGDDFLKWLERFSPLVEWRATVRPLINSTARTAVRSLASDLGLSFDVLTPGISAYTQRHAAELITRVTDTTKQAVRDTLNAGLEKGETIDELRKRITDLGEFNDTRGELIARTETTAVSNGAQRASMSEYAAANGVRVEKTWLATMDSRTREEHLDLDGEVQDIDDEFTNGLQEPGEPNCRCTLTYEILEAA